MPVKGSFAKVLKEQSRTSNKMVREAAQEFGEGMKSAIRLFTPNQNTKDSTGRLYASIKTARVKKAADGRGGYDGSVYTTLYYAWFVENGYRGGTIEAGPGKYFVVGGRCRPRKKITRAPFHGLHMFKKGAFEFTSSGAAQGVLWLEMEEWARASAAKSKG